MNKHITTRKTGNEHFHSNGQRLDVSLLSFWQWSSSEVLGNSLRGILAEYIVAQAIGSKAPIREEWDMYDLITPDGVKIEVKSASYLQSWAQEKHSAISFGIQPTYGWDASTNSHANEQKRQADIYVFCVLAHKDKATVDPLNLNQWDFYVLSTEVLNTHKSNQKTISLAPLLRLNPLKVAYDDIARAINELTFQQST